MKLNIFQAQIAQTMRTGWRRVSGAVRLRSCGVCAGPTMPARTPRRCWGRNAHAGQERNRRTGWAPSAGACVGHPPMRPPCERGLNSGAQRLWLRSLHGPRPKKPAVGHAAPYPARQRAQRVCVARARDNAKRNKQSPGQRQEHRCQSGVTETDLARAALRSGLVCPGLPADRRWRLRPRRRGDVAHVLPA